jgi:hypothetical protein
MTRPLSTLGAPAESSSAPEIPITIREVSVEDAETFWTDGTDARSPEPEPRERRFHRLEDSSNRR